MGQLRQQHNLEYMALHLRSCPVIYLLDDAVVKLPEIERARSDELVETC